MKYNDDRDNIIWIYHHTQILTDNETFFYILLIYFQISEPRLSILKCAHISVSGRRYSYFLILIR